MRLLETADDGRTGTALLGDVRYTVDLSLLEEAKPGQYLIVHAGFAIERLDEKEAKERIALFRELAAGSSDEKQ